MSLLVVCLGAGCASKKEASPKTSAIVPGTHIPGNRMAAIRTPEVVKAYATGRYTDPNYPDEMHERHTVYRREQSPDWNYLPDPPPILPNGNPSQYVDASGQLNAKQRAYAEALQEQNRAMQKRIETLQQEVKKLLMVVFPFMPLPPWAVMSALENPVIQQLEKLAEKYYGDGA